MGVTAILIHALVAGEGPGIASKQYGAEQLYKPMGYIDSSKKGVRGHAAMAFFKGYLTMVEGRDSGQGDGAIAFFDISDPTQPKRVATHTDQHTKKLFEGHNYGFTVIDGRDIVFLIAQSGLQVWDWTDIQKPKYISSLNLPKMKKGAYADTAWWLAMQYPYIYVGGTNTGMHIVKVDELAAPRLVKRIPTSKLGGFKVGSLFACGNFLVLNTFDAKGISLLDISDPVNPQLTKVIKEAFGYSCLFNGGYLYGIAERPKIWDLRDPINARLVSEYKGEKLGSKGGYGVIQDGILHQGASSGYAKVDVSDPTKPKLIKRVSMKIPHQDFDGANVIGNYVVMSCDHGTGSHIIAHQEAPDTVGPRVNYISPVNGSNNNHLLSRIGMTFTDEIDHHHLDNVVVREIDGAVLKGHWSLHNAILNFCPAQPLKPATTYEVVLPKGSILDQVGNPMEESFRSVFSTGKILSEFKVAINKTEDTKIGDEVSFTPKSEGRDQTVYAWDFGDGSAMTKFGPSATVKHLYKTPGRYQVILHARRGNQRAVAQISQLVYRQGTAQSPAYSASVAYDAVNNRVWNVNPDNGTVTVTDGSDLKLIRTLAVGPHPRTLCISNGMVAVAEQDQAGLTLFDAKSLKQLKTVPLGNFSQPYGVVLSHDAQTAWVSSQALGVVYQVNCQTEKVERVLEVAAGKALRGLALTSDGKTLLATRFKSADEQAEIYSVDLRSGRIKILPLAVDQGPDTEDSGRGVPNYLSQVVISPDGSQAWVPSKKDNILRGKARDGEALTFENTVRTIVSKIDLTTGKEVIGHRHDFNDKDMASAAVYSPHGDLLFVACQGSNSVEVIDAYSGEHLTSILRVGSAPQGLALNPKGILYVHNFLSRSVVSYDVADIMTLGNGVADQLHSVTTVQSDKLSPTVLLGKQLFYHAGDPRMSRDGYLSCASCHLDGDQDGRVWDFTDRGEGLRNTISLLGKAGEKHGRLHWSANFDEVQDFEHDIRGAFGGEGFINKEQSPKEFFANWHPLGFPKAGASRDLDAIAAYVRSLNVTPNSPYRDTDGSLSQSGERGRKIFKALDCISCHGGDDFTDSPSHMVHNVGTLGKSSGRRLGGNLEGIDTPSLKGVWATAPYLHDGSAATLREVLVVKNKEGKHGETKSLKADEFDDLLAYLQQIDDREPSAGVKPTNSKYHSAMIVDDNMIARRIMDAVNSGKAIAPISGLSKQKISMDEAYRIQGAFDRYMQQKFGSITGYKMAYASKASQEKWGIPAPVSGTFFKKQQIPSGGSVKAGSFINFHIESEIAFTLKKDIKKPIKNVKDLMPYLKSVHVGLDVPDLRFDRSKGDVTVADVIAMSCGTHTYVMGKGVNPKKVDYSKMHVTLKRDKKLVYEGKASNVLGDPRESLRMLANRLIKSGNHLRRGQVVLTGSVAGAYFPKEAKGRPGKYIGEATGLPAVELNVQ